jgi:hypothetical protein
VEISSRHHLAGTISSLFLPSPLGFILLFFFSIRLKEIVILDAIGAGAKLVAWCL